MKNRTQHHQPPRIARHVQLSRSLGRAVAGTMLVAGLSVSDMAKAAENAAGFYLLGVKGPAAGVLPPPGVFVQNDFYFYDGHFGGGKALPLGGNIVAGLKAQLYADFVTFLAVAPWEIAGGNLGFTLAVPFGGPDVTVRSSLRGPRGRTFDRSLTDSTFTLGDLVMGPMLGWHAGKFHWTAGISVNVPVGDYHPGRIANIAFHRWGVDFSGALTWLDPETGIDLSGAIGITVNGKNPKTDYKTGTELHLEWAISKYLSKDFSIGLLGYHYQQISNDSGSGAALGGFRGRVTAVGATMGGTIHVGKLPISARIKMFTEFNTKNRMDGNAVFLTASMPLAVFSK